MRAGHWPVAATVGVVLLSGCQGLRPGSAASTDCILQEVWFEIPGDTVADLTDHAKYAGPADSVRLASRLEASGLGVNYGSRWTTRVVPPATGDYTFWLGSDDGGELWLSAGEGPAGLRRVAWVEGWTDPGVWDAQPGQTSEPVRLDAGRGYLLRVLQKQGGGGNHVAVAWQGPGLERQVLASPYLRLPLVDPGLQTRIAETAKADAERRVLREKAEAYWIKGKTLPVELATRFPVSAEGAPPNDTGINLLVDQAHQTQFAVLWGLRGQLREQGFRACSSVASLGSVLTPGKPCRIRAMIDDIEPFAWWPAAEFNVVMTSQQDLNAQPYSPAEQVALRRFLEDGGGLLVLGTRPPDEAAAKAWSMNQFLEGFGARYTHEVAKTPQGSFAALGLGPEWEALVKDEAGRPVRARRAVGKGRVVLAEGPGVFIGGDKDPQDASERRQKDLRDLVAWLAGGKAPVGGECRLPSVGGVGIFPELERNLGGVVVYYAGNQKPEVLECIEKHIPRAAEKVLGWLPTKVFDEPYTIVICAGGGGGWAINPRPKAAAVIAYDPIGILGVFAHEMAHTMSGPGNDQGVVAGYSPHHNQGEAHAGWFQGKVQALFGDIPDKANRDCNSILDLEAKKGAQLDLATEHETESGRAKWGKGPEWTKLWYIFQKLDDRYGPTWYPRWYWVRSTRWAEEPGHRETWEEMVEDMSIAVGEDLFPFFRRAGTTLKIERLERISFQGKVLELTIAPIQAGPAGAVSLEPVGDYTKPLRPRGA